MKKRKKALKKKYVFFHLSPLDKHYTADAFVVRCLDKRCGEVFDRFIESLGLRWIENPESPAGGAKIFSDPEKEGDQDFMLREIEKSIKLHHTKKIMLFTHSNCGAYGGLARFGGDKEKEFEFHTRELRKAKKVVKKRFPRLKIETYFIDEVGIVKV